MNRLMILLIALCLMACNESARKSDSYGGRADSIINPPTATRNNDTDQHDYNRYKGNPGKKEKINVSYSVLGCECAHWQLNNDTTKAPELIFLERAVPSLPDADTIYDGTNIPIRLILEGAFYEKPGYPNGYHPVKGNPEPARVFRYTGFKRVQNFNQLSIRR